MFEYNAVLDRVVDGDTIDATIDANGESNVNADGV